VHANGSVKLADFGLAKEVTLCLSVHYFHVRSVKLSYGCSFFVQLSDVKNQYAKVMQRKCLLDGT
jgi:hypothetical protein